MIVRVKLDKIHEQIINYLVKKGAATNKSEAIRLIIMHYNEHFGIVPLSPKSK